MHGLHVGENVQQLVEPATGDQDEQTPRCGEATQGRQRIGLDLAILKTFDFDKYRPKLICAETMLPDKPVMNTETAAFLDAKGYAARCMTFPNTIFVDRKLLG